MAARAEKAYYQFNKGINTEGSLIAFPEGFSTDEENYDLFIDGSRRRRRGLLLEAGGANKPIAQVTQTNILDVTDGLVSLLPRRTIITESAHDLVVGEFVTIQDLVGTGSYDINGTWEVLDVPNSTSFRIIGSGDPTGGYVGDGIAVAGDTSPKATRAHKWEGVDGNTALNFKILQVGIDLYIYEDTGNILSLGIKNTTVNLMGFKLENATEEDIRENFVDVAYGRGNAFVVGKFIQPFYISFDSVAENFSTTTLIIHERDFEGIDDGVGVNVFPTTLTNAHNYNLLNRGWTETFISDFFASKSYYPSKSMIPYLGLKRTLTSSNTYDNDGVRVFSPDKLVAELFQDATAPQGHFIRDPFNPTRVYLDGTGVSIIDWSISEYMTGSRAVGITTDVAHGVTMGGSFTITGHSATIGVFDSIYGTRFVTLSLDGTYNATSVTSDTITFDYFLGIDYVNGGTFSSTNSYGTVSANILSASTESPYRPTCTAFYAGRVWYAGTPHKQQAGRIYFSQIIESDNQYYKCYQVADPTDERISDILPTDGGVIVIPEVGNILKLLPYGSSLLVFATAGIWQIGAGQGGVFSATSYSVRKITDIGCVSGNSVVLANGIPYYFGASDIFLIMEDTQTSLLVARNITEGTIHSLYLSILNKDQAQGVYDDVQHRIVWLYSSDEDTPDFAYDHALCLHTTLGAFTKYSFTYDTRGYVVSVTTPRDSTSSTKKIKFICITNYGSTLTIAEAIAEDFLDFGNNEEEAYIVSGPETLGDASKFRYAPYIWVFSKKTETGFTQDGTDLYIVGESSTKMQARWDWADLGKSGKWGPIQEVYRRTRFYQPESVSDGFDDGTPLIVTRNKVRGRGRCLQIKLYSGAGKDSHIAGWHVKHDVHTET